MPKTFLIAIAVSIVVTSCRSGTGTQSGPATLLVRNKLKTAVQNVYILRCAEDGLQPTDSLSSRDEIAPASERKFKVVSGCYDAIFTRDSVVTANDSSSYFAADTVARRTHMQLEAGDQYLIVLAE